MQFDKTKKIHKAAARDESRYMMNGVLLDLSEPDKPMLVATDGRGLAAIPCDLIPGAGIDTHGLIPVDAIKLACKAKKSNPALVVANGTVQVTTMDGVTVDYGERPETNFPDWRTVAPKPEDDDLVVRINPVLLLAISEAIGLKGSGVEAVELRFKREQRKGRDEIDDATPIGVTLDGDDSIGVVMPIART